MARTLIIAEAGVNHNGSLDRALDLINAASQAGADYVKFQTWKSNSIISVKAPKAAYQKAQTGDSETMLDMIKKLELPYEAFTLLKEHCIKSSIGFLSTAFDIESAIFIYSLGTDFFKIPSGEITNLPLLEVISQFSVPVLLSTGMCVLYEIESALKILQKGACKKITLLHCNTQYPTPFADVNLYAIEKLKTEFGLPVGLSDHSEGIEVPIAAAALGAAVIEKHFTLSRALEGPDHKSSLEPGELYKMVASIRNIEAALGEREKKPSDSEKENISIVRKSIVASRKIFKGEEFTSDNITCKRPGTGISPMRWHEILGSISKRDFKEDEMIEI